MTYDECYKMIIDNFESKISTKDKLLKIKIYNILLKWYKNNFEEELKFHFETDNKLGITNVLNRIEFVCRKNDSEKMKLVYANKNYEDFIKLSNYIFSLVIKFIENKDSLLSDDDFIEYNKKIKSYSSLIPKLLLEKYEYYKSECILDLNYLKSEGNVQIYSFRTSNLLRNRK